MQITLSNSFESTPANDSSLSIRTHMDGCMQAMQSFYDSFGESLQEIQEPSMQEYSLDLLSFGDDYGQFLLPEFTYGECTEQAPSNPCSDAYISFLLDGGPSPSFDALESDSFKFTGDQDSSSTATKKDMDLIEMLSSSQSSCSQRSSNSSRSYTLRRE